MEFSHSLTLERTRRSAFTLEYTGGQRLVVHLEADLDGVVRWAEAHGVRSAFSDRHAGTRYTCFYKDLTHLDQIDWGAVAARDFRDPLVKEGKQAEFPVHTAFPWSLVRWIGTCDRRMAERAMQALDGANHQPLVSVETE